MPLASSSAVTLRAQRETTFGQIPVTGNPYVLRVTGETLKFAVTKDVSKEINKTRTVNSVIPTSANSSGAVTGEISYLAFDDLLESVMQGTWGPFGTNGVGIATATTGITTTAITAAAATTGTSAFTTLQEGQWFKITSAGANNGKIARVSSTVAPTSTVLTLDPSTPLVASTGESIQVEARRLTHGTTQTSYTIERENSDIGVFIAYTGMTPSKLTVNIASGSLSSISFDFMGKAGMEANATQLPGSPIAAPTFDIHSGVAGATSAIWMNGVPLTGTYVKSVALTFDNTLREQDAIGTLGAVGIGSGTIACTAQLSVYFADKTLFTQFRQNAYGSVGFATSDAAGNGYVFTFPKTNVSDFTTNASAKDQDQMLDITVTALSDDGNAISALRKLMFIDAFGVATA